MPPGTRHGAHENGGLAYSWHPSHRVPPDQRTSLREAPATGTSLRQVRLNPNYFGFSQFTRPVTGV